LLKLVLALSPWNSFKGPAAVTLAETAAETAIAAILFFLRGKEKQKKIHKKKYCAIDSSKQLQVAWKRSTEHEIPARICELLCLRAQQRERRRRRRHFFYGQNREKSNYTTTDVVPKTRTSRASMLIKFPSGQRI
jgi:hypothetical protein